MDSDPTAQIQQRLAELPADVQAAIQSSDLHTKLVAIGDTYKLHIDQVGELEEEVLLAMLGFVPIESLGQRLSSTLRLPSDIAEHLSGDINAQIFGAIRESMKAFAAKKAAATTATPPVAEPQVAAPQAPVVSTPVAPAAPSLLPIQPPVSPDMHKADVVLTQSTTSLPVPTAPTVPAPAASAPNAKPIYKADPYREPII